MTYDFDTVIDRRGSGATKYEELQEMFGSRDLLPLWIADMDFAVCPEITQALQRRIAHPIYGYSMPPESYWQSILQWLDHRHGFKVQRQELTYVPGVVKGIAFAVNFFTRPGDKVLIQPPVYHPFRLVTENNGRQVVANPLKANADGTYTMDLEGLEEAMATQRPKLMILCNPHNPIGIQWDQPVLARVGALAWQYGVTVVSDEIHGDLLLHGRRHIPFAVASADCAAVAVTFGAPSKTFNIPGLVSSWCVVKNPELREPFFRWLEANELNAPTFVSTIATEAAYRYGEGWLDQALRYIEGNIEATRAFLAEHLPQVRIVEPQASFLVWMDFRALGLTHQQLVDLVVKHAGLALNDGEMFGTQGHGFMRVNIATPRASLLAALQRLADAINNK